MELLEFREKIIELCGVGEVKEIGDVLISKVLKNDTGFFDKYFEAVDDNKDWLQALWQYYNADRKGKKQDYTPASLCKLVSRLAGECKTVYDCCGGSGALTKSVARDPANREARRYLADSDFLESVILCPRNMFESTDIATCIFVLDKNKKNKRTTTFVDAQNVFEQEAREQNGQFGGASHTGRTYKKIVNVFSDKNISDILDAIKKQGNVPDFCKTVATEEITKNEYLYQPSRYIDVDSQKPAHRDFKEIAENINYIAKIQNSCKLVINETLAQKLGFDLALYKRDREDSKKLHEQMASIGISVNISDYIQFTKNKNEFVFKCNDKELLPEILLQFLSVWKNQIALLNTMQNQYLAELRDALLPDLMSGKICIGGEKQ